MREVSKTLPVLKSITLGMYADPALIGEMHKRGFVVLTERHANRIAAHFDVHLDVKQEDRCLESIRTQLAAIKKMKP